ncbi:transketolase [Candidatus Sumerlaeota bacterium]|nr:transketolase [Candidatus Sumerlaeota bacterium]
MEEKKLFKLAADTIRCLSMDTVQKAESGHPGMPMGCADLALSLWLKFLKYNPKDPGWLDRDRFVLSAGHGSALLYILLHLAGFDLSLDDLRAFRQWGSRTPGHPEFRVTPGVETTTGPLGQGFANGVGMAIAERHLAEIFNEPGFLLVDHFTYGIVSDGDLMEGVSSEAASLAGHLGLGKLIYIYDSNRISIEGSTEITFDTEDVMKRFQAYGWDTHEIDGHSFEEVETALAKAKEERGKPSFILAHTNIASGSPEFQGSEKSHGAPLGKEGVQSAKRNLGFDENKEFFVPQEVSRLFADREAALKKSYDDWRRIFEEYRKQYPQKAELWDQYHNPPSEETLEKVAVEFDPAKSTSTREASGKCLQVLGSALPNLLGGSADLAPSTKTFMKGLGVISRNSFSGRNMRFGVREHAMGGVMNGMALHGGVIPFGGTFLVFSDYMRPSIRLAALMNLRVIYVFTHDSFHVGEDGPTHEPVEHLMSLRLIPNLTVIRPADAMETLEAWKMALRQNGPTALILTRQNLPVLERSPKNPASDLAFGAYVLWGGEEKADCLIMASGSEASLSVQAAAILKEKGIRARVVGFPSWELFEKQSIEYKKKILPDSIKIRLAVEAGRSLGWERYVGEKGMIHGMDRFGASAPSKVLAEKFGFTPQTIAEKAIHLLSL